MVLMYKNRSCKHWKTAEQTKCRPIIDLPNTTCFATKHVHSDTTSLPQYYREKG